LSGAGSSVIAFSKPGATAGHIGHAMQKAFAAHHVASRFQVLALENKGVKIS
jgi:homoserine kinase